MVRLNGASLLAFVAAMPAVINPDRSTAGAT